MRAEAFASRAACAFVVLATASCDERVGVECAAPRGGAGTDIVGFHGGREKLGHVADETELTPAAVASPRFGKRWSSAPFEPVRVDGNLVPAHVYASPLFLHDVAIGGARHDVVLTATSSGDVYALSAFGARGNTSCTERGRVLWRTRIVSAVVVPNLDGGVPLGVLSTPIVDRALGRLFVVGLDVSRGWLAFALDLATGAVVPGWPVALDASALEAANVNGPARFHDPREISQRGALALSPSGDRLYVGFGSFRFASVGWLAAIDTANARLARSFSTAPFSEPTSNGGIWGAGGPAVDEAGDVWIATGNSPPGTADAERSWGNSILHLSRDLAVSQVYTPFNYCKLDAHNIDLAGSAPLLLPAFSSTQTNTPLLLASGGKQGNVYLLDRNAMERGRDRRPPCSTDSTSDRSLLPPEPQPQFGARGPLNVFGPYSDERGEVDYAKMRSRPAYFAREGAAPMLFVSGATKAAADSTVNVAPALARLAVVLEPGRDAFLRIDAYARELVFVNPGSPVVSSARGAGAVVWIVDENAPRVASLLDPAVPRPVLYAVDGATMSILYRSPPGALAVGGKYVTPAIARGHVFVTTDRLEAFGLEP